jgi:hypothetical protein
MRKAAGLCMFTVRHMVCCRWLCTDYSCCCCCCCCCLTAFRVSVSLLVTISPWAHSAWTASPQHPAECPRSRSSLTSTPTAS